MIHPGCTKKTENTGWLTSPPPPPHPLSSPQAVYLESEPFSLQNNLLTPTQKLKRMEARERYQAIIDELYGKLDQKRQAPVPVAARL